MGGAALFCFLGPVQLSVYPHSRQTSRCLQRARQIDNKHLALNMYLPPSLTNHPIETQVRKAGAQ